MRNEEVKYCDETGKYCYSSEAKASRAVNRYNDIQRTYFCDHCDSWHTTSMTEELAIKEGLLIKEEKVKKPSRKVQRRLEKLLKQEFERQTTLITKTK